jgi:hypothetical protein
MRTSTGTMGTLITLAMPLQKNAKKRFLIQIASGCQPTTSVGNDDMRYWEQPRKERFFTWFTPIGPEKFGSSVLETQTPAKNDVIEAEESNND